MGALVMSVAVFLRIVLILLVVGVSRPAVAGTLLIVGDSLSAGYGVPSGSDWVSLLNKRLMSDYPDVSLVNASISGETTAGGKRRIGALLQRHQPDVVVVELGANDGLRGIRIPLIRDNLAAIVDACLGSGAKILVIGMRVPPNYGREYAEKFHNMFRQVSLDSGASLVPFMLDGFADDRAMFQDDGIHPSRDAQPLIRDTIYEQLQPLLNDL
jgi:acyl-CoA thioesterase-1